MTLCTPTPLRREECETAYAVLVINAWFCFHLVFQDSVDSRAAGVFLVGFKPTDILPQPWNRYVDKKYLLDSVSGWYSVGLKATYTETLLNCYFLLAFQFSFCAIMVWVCVCVWAGL